MRQLISAAYAEATIQLVKTVPVFQMEAPESMLAAYAAAMNPHAKDATELQTPEKF